MIPKPTNKKTSYCSNFGVLCLNVLSGCNMKAVCILPEQELDSSCFRKLLICAHFLLTHFRLVISYKYMVIVTF